MATCLFDRPHHRRIAMVLQALDPLPLVSRGCLFGGGTAISLRWGEYRESVDIAFLVSHQPGYRELRQALTTAQGVGVLARPGSVLTQLCEVRADQYGLRTLLEVDGAAIKFEIVLEARITLEPPALDDQVCGIATLTPLDMATSKLLANADRWADDSVHSRDLIDLAMMQPGKALLASAIKKAEGAYGDSVLSAMRKSSDYLLNRKGRLAQCMRAMQMTAPPALVLQRIKALAKRAPPPPI